MISIYIILFLTLPPEKSSDPRGKVKTKAPKVEWNTNLENPLLTDVMSAMLQTKMKLPIPDK